MAELRVGAVQMDAPVGAVDANLHRAAVLVEQAAARGAQLVVLPELFNTGYEYTDRNFSLAEPIDGRTGRWLHETACRLGVHLVGTFPARAPDAAHITATLVAPDGRQWTYRKMHVAAWENAFFARGAEPVVADTDLGRIGLMICWDQTFTDLARAYQGRVDLLCIPSSPPSFVGRLEDPGGRLLIESRVLRALGTRLEAVRWFDEATGLQARSAGVPVVYAARCGPFYSPLPYGLMFLPALGARAMLRVLRAVGTDFRMRCQLMGHSRILDSSGAALAEAGREGEAVLVANVMPGAPDPATLPPVPRGRTIVPGVPLVQLWLDDVAIVLGRRYRRRHGTNVEYAV